MTGTVTVEPEDPRFDVLVFSKTTGFRHESRSPPASRDPADGRGRQLQRQLSEDPTLFTDAGLRAFEVVVFLNTDGEGILNAAQRTAFERWTQRGGGIVGIHADANADRNWAWKGDMMGGALFLNHPAGALQFQHATVRVEDHDAPRHADVPRTWVREDEWYNFTAEPRGRCTSCSSSTRAPTTSRTAAPAARRPPDRLVLELRRRAPLLHRARPRGRVLVRARTTSTTSAARSSGPPARRPGDCGAPREGLPTDASFDKVTLDDTTENPMEIAVAPDGDVYYVELAGARQALRPADNERDVVGTIPVHRGNENGLLGITLDPNFATNHWLYLFYSAPETRSQHVSRFTLARRQRRHGAEKVLLGSRTSGSSAATRPAR